MDDGKRAFGAFDNGSRWQIPADLHKIISHTENTITVSWGDLYAILVGIDLALAEGETKTQCPSAAPAIFSKTKMHMNLWDYLWEIIYY